jgi:FMN phosphatase YigB (HAD superfamily)
VDHTLVDWTAGWANATRALLAVLRQSGCHDDAVLGALRESHRRHGTMDCPGALEEVALELRPRLSRATLARAAGAHSLGWEQARHPLAGVVSGLARMARAGCRIVAYTESPADATIARLGLAGVDGAFDWLISTTSTAPGTDARLAVGPTGPWRIRRVDTVPAWSKGSPLALREMFHELRVPPERVCVVGDHFEKDVVAAELAGATAAWARYGAARRPADDALVQATCHWDASASAKATPAAGPVKWPLRRFDEVLVRLEPVRGQHRAGGVRW